MAWQPAGVRYISQSQALFVSGLRPVCGCSSVVSLTLVLCQRQHSSYVCVELAQTQSLS